MASGSVPAVRLPIAAYIEEALASRVHLFSERIRQWSLHPPFVPAEETAVSSFDCHAVVSSDARRGPIPSAIPAISIDASVNYQKCYFSSSAHSPSVASEHRLVNYIVIYENSVLESENERLSRRNERTRRRDTGHVLGLAASRIGDLSHSSP